MNRSPTEILVDTFEVLNAESGIARSPGLHGALFGRILSAYKRHEVSLCGLPQLRLQMATIQEEVLDTFYRKLAQTEGFAEAKVQALREIFSDGKKPKAADVIRVLAEPTKTELP